MLQEPVTTMPPSSPAFRALRTAPTLRLALSATAILAAALAASGVAQARSSDRNQPMDINANSSDCGLNDNEQCKFVGNVVVTQGTLEIQAATATIQNSNGDPTRALLTGSPVRMAQLLDNGSRFNATASNVDYNLANDTVVLTGDVAIDQPGRGSLKSQRVVYNLKTGKIESGGEAGGRVSVRFIPKSSQAPKPAPGGN